MLLDATRWCSWRTCKRCVCVCAQVRFAPDNNMNNRSRYVFLRQCAAYNIMIAPHDPWDKDCVIYDVLDRWRKYEDHALS